MDIDSSIDEGLLREFPPQIAQIVISMNNQQRKYKSIVEILVQRCENASEELKKLSYLEDLVRVQLRTFGRCFLWICTRRGN